MLTLLNKKQTNLQSKYCKKYTSYLIVHLQIGIFTEYSPNKEVISTDLDIGLVEAGLVANKDEKVDKVAHTSPIIANQKSTF